MIAITAFYFHAVNGNIMNRCSGTDRTGRT